ncbi:PI-PLC X domain-containing protein 1-like [Uloborus diversus]|uniref:PI-PLC X domain-containing protein 1-like n=1 Tax=Uloborus diversus TaxID=327109 RepID=UPI002409A370|nr:PI-PLC X domain-containing protein 1-like [Uloborus diversus]
MTVSERHGGVLCILFLFGMSEVTFALLRHDVNDGLGFEVSYAGGTEVKPVVFLTVSSLASRTNNVEDRIIEMNWDYIAQQDVEAEVWVKLYNADPLANHSDPLISVRPSSAGYHRTNIKYPEIAFTTENLTDTCLGFWITYERNSEISSWNCLRARPHWMNEIRSILGNMSLIEMMIPGTHNAGSYGPFNRNEDNRFNRYLLNQEENIWSQLVYGIRYLDLRVAYHDSVNPPEKFWITHSSFRTEVPVREAINQVKRFLNATSEIVIMDFHRFVGGFQGQDSVVRHQELIHLLEEELADYMIPAGFTPWVTLNSLWDVDRRLYVGYADNNARRQSQYLFPAIKHLWGDVDKVRDLKAYLNRTVCSTRAPRGLTSAMAQLTPSTMGAIFDFYGGLRNMADAVNRQITKWFRDEWSHCANIVSTDYFLGNNIIEIAIETNKRRRPLPGTVFS